MLSYIKGLFQDFATWLYDFLMWWPKTIFASLMEGLAELFVYVMDTLCAQTCSESISAINSGISGIPSNILYFADILHVGTGIGLMLSAYGIRFIIRRIPIIG